MIVIIMIIIGAFRCRCLWSGGGATRLAQNTLDYLKITQTIYLQIYVFQYIYIYIYIYMLSKFNST